MRYFYFDGHSGSVDKHGFVLWAGMGFQLDAAKPALREAILRACNP